MKPASEAKVENQFREGQIRSSEPKFAKVEFFCTDRHVMCH